MKDTFIILLTVFAIFMALGYFNGSDIDACVARGHSYAACNHAFNR